MCVPSHSAILCGLGFVITPLKCSLGGPGFTSLGIVACDIFSFEIHSHMDLPSTGSSTQLEPPYPSGLGFASLRFMESLVVVIESWYNWLPRPPPFRLLPMSSGVIDGVVSILAQALPALG